MRFSWVSLLLVAACGRLGFDARTAPVDGDIVTDASTSDDAAACVADPCTLVLPQCGCPAGMACHRTGETTETRDCVVEGTAGADGACTQDFECTGGHTCVAQTPSSGRCHRYCAADDDCAPGLACAQLTEGVGVGLCGSACTLDGGCPAGSTCKVILAFDFDSPGPVAVPLCGAPNGNAAGAACTSTLDCGAGLFCDDGNICRRMCRFDGTLDCAAGTCTDPLAPIKLGGVAHGFCR